MAAPKKYNPTAKGLMKWAEHELKHVGKIAAVEDPDIQYSYALSTVNGMAHLKDALFERVSAETEERHKKDLLITHDKVIRVMKHLVKEYGLDVKAIEDFNVKKVLSPLTYLKGGRRATRRSSRTRRGSRRA